jgi:PIN domain
MAPSKPREAIVLDTNAWVRGTRLLRSPLGLAFLHTATQRGSVLLLPEVIEKEVHAVVARSCIEASTKIKKAREELHSLLSREIPMARLPDEKTAQAAVNERLEQCNIVIERVPLTLAQSRGALERVYHKRPPCDRSEEFRDAVIWEVVREWSAKMPVFFITQDTAFYRGRDPKNGLAESLARDSIGRVNVSQDLSLYLNACKKRTTTLPAGKRVTALLEGSVREELYGLDSEQSIELNELTAADLNPFLTDHPEHLAYRFRLTYAGRARLEDGAPPIKCPIVVAGEALLDRKLKLIDVELEFVQVGDRPAIPFLLPEEDHRFEFLPPITYRISARSFKPLGVASTD